MENFIGISAHINKLLEYFGHYFDHPSMPRRECLGVLSLSHDLHQTLIDQGDLSAYDQHLELAESAYKSMLNKVNHQQIIDDILFCGSSDLSWEESSRCISNLHHLNISSKEVFAFYYLHEINNKFYIDSPLPSR